VVLKTIKMEGQDLRMRQSGMDLEYLKSVPGLLKIIEIVCTCFEIGDVLCKHKSVSANNLEEHLQRYPSSN